MKRTLRPRINIEPICALLAQMAACLAELLAGVGAERLVREFLNPFALFIKRGLFMRACVAADLRTIRPVAKLHHAHVWISTRAIMRAMLSKELRNLATGDDRARILRLQKVLANADSIVAKMTRTILRKTGTFNLRRLIYAPPRTLTFAGACPAPSACAADTS